MASHKYQYCPSCRSALILVERGGKQRLSCPQNECGFVHWANPVPVVAAIVERDQHVVLVRSLGWPDSWYGLVAGFLETGETPEEAVLREVTEEIGIEAEMRQLVGVYPFETMNQLIFVYHLAAERGEIRLCEDELADYKLVPIERVKPWSRGTGPALRDWLASRGLFPEVVEFGTPL